ncbi:hypothetical protein K7B10_23355 [Streptomyces flavotricini]|uniref:DUF6545 domain-containing protein n=1 Tax=Streptomyces flavotricini TaxID=66888 RepID=A0ABS8EBQ2_9ACTN|nr:DUF6545 domain-containing protein [Streptomyces flavotricini]MCC0097664.1 hypothetical protein [Streptomyces flavotricini]
MDQGVNFYIPACALAVVLIVKFPALLRGWRVPMVRSVNLALALGGAALTFSAPPTIVVVNRLTGVSNFSAPLVYVILCASSCSFLVLIENWRADSRHQAATRRRVRRWIVAYGLVGAVIIGCFVLGEAPDERLSDFDTYYSSTPFIREMIASYLLAHCVAAGATTVLSWKWSLEISKETRKDSASTEVVCLRRGLVLLVIGFGMNLFWGIVKLTGAMSGSRQLNEGVAPVISLGALVLTTGCLIPVFGPPFIERVWRPWWAYRALNPLRRTVRPAKGVADQPALLELPWYAGPEQRLVHRVTSIQDWMLGLRPYFDDDVRERARRVAEGQGAPESEAAVLGLAAMVRTAAADRARGVKAGTERSNRAVGAYREAEAEYRDLAQRLSRALLLVPEPDAHRRTSAGA